MLIGEKILLRARHEGDVAVLHARPDGRMVLTAAARRGVAVPARGRGLGTDVVRVLCRYGFGVRGLHRLQVDTLADNAAMIGAAERAGFRVEGTLRGAAWVSGRFVDEVLLGLLAAHWSP
ncbi:GNAT family N-acetyltransferase [Kitasatospora sp. NPDC059673]|uniref:GNAT family N-acetyltransferase n=1 Tax=Kitasatospora sp. NPDC059673 TaxID=3346901 RepID=UPI0036C345E0